MKEIDLLQFQVDQSRRKTLHNHVVVTTTLQMGQVALMTRC